MTLRLLPETEPAPTAPTAVPADASRAREAASTEEARRVEELVARGASLLSAGMFEGYLACFGETAQLSPQRRYQAGKLLLERGIALSGGREGARLIEVLVVLAEAVIGMLEAEPAEPVLLNYAGVLMYELWSLEAARALFHAARRLDPEIAQLSGNLAGVAARQRSLNALPSNRRRPRIHPSVPGLAARARRLAGQARPANGLTLSLCMIVKDEAEMLPRCLAAVAPAVDEIVIVDTGSSDATMEIAHSFGALVIERPWTGSFAEARNASFDAASGDWILYLDADEVLVADDAERLRRLRKETWREAFFLHETNWTGNEEAGVAVVHSALRMFRNRPEYRFSGRLHEQIAQTLPTFLPERVAQSPVRVEHFGYLNSVRSAKEKSRRNVELLLKQRTDGHPAQAFDHFNLGSEYLALEEFGAAATEYERAWTMAVDGGQFGLFVPSLAGRLVSALRQSGRAEAALARATEALRHFPDFTDLVYQQALACLTLGRAEEAERLLDRCIEMGDAPSRYTAILGSGTYLPRIALAERQLAEGRPEAALVHLRWCAEHHPGFFGTYHPYTLALVAAGIDPAAAVAEIDRALGDRSTSMIRFLIAGALVQTGAYDTAAEQLGAVLDRRPGNPQALELLLECQLIAQRFELFETTLADFGDCGLPERDRRERLAQLYLRHGYLRSAAREWLAVTETCPDAPALRGLAEVARRNGQPEAAAGFAAEALKFATVPLDTSGR